MSTPTVADVWSALTRWGPSDLAEPWDNVGLQVGDQAQPVLRGLIALDATPQVLAEAVATGANVVVTHHPLLFKPSKRFAAGAGPSGLAFAFARAGISLVSAHTNLDSARDGVSFALASQLGLSDTRVLRPSQDRFAKLIAFVPTGHVDAVRKALADAGAGELGNYAECSFVTGGTGTFRPLDGSSPWTATPTGELARESEIRLEILAPRVAKAALIRALRDAHPYEEPAFDWIEVGQEDRWTGLGAIGELPSAMEPRAFLDHVCHRLDTPAVRAAVADKPIQRVAVCGGSGSSFLPLALKSGADAYVTADVTYHLFSDVLDADGNPRLTYVTAGHYETERVTEQILVAYLADQLPAIAWSRTQTRTDPSRVHVAER